MRAAKWLGCKPWELDTVSIYWQRVALTMIEIEANPNPRESHPDD